MSFYEIVGRGVTGVLVMIVVICIWFITINAIGRMKLDYKRKHRFKKKPLAKCYCKDCVNHNPKTHYCYRASTTNADDWFCKDAEPVSFDRGWKED